MVHPQPRLKLPNEVAALVRSLHPQIKRKIRSALDEVLREPLSGKQLRGELSGYRSFRAGRIRIIYREGAEVIEIVAIGRREVIYFETALLLRHTPPKA